MEDIHTDQIQVFSNAYDEHADTLFRHCYFRVSNREIALDLVQECFMKTWQHIEKGNDVRNIKAFLFTVINNLIIDHYRKKKAISLDTLSSDGFDPAGETGNEMVEEAEVARVIEVLEALPAQYRDVMVMRYVDGLPVKEIASHIGESENVVSVRLHRATKKVREMMET